MSDTKKVKADMFMGVEVTPLVIKPGEKLLLVIKDPNITNAALGQLTEMLERFMKEPAYPCFILKGEMEFFLLQKDATVEVTDETND